jgi:hypothetical protein
MEERKKHWRDGSALYAPRDTVAYISDQFPIVRRKDEERFGEYRTKRVILEMYDAMQDARRTGRPWTSLDR